MSSVQLLDEAAAERQRVELINRLVKEQIFPADFDGARAREEGRTGQAGRRVLGCSRRRRILEAASAGSRQRAAVAAVCLGPCHIVS
jgi:ABC-type lipoprotein export system ATPase subunit